MCLLLVNHHIIGCPPGSSSLSFPSQTEGDGFDPEGQHPTFARDGYSFVPKSCH